MLTQTQKEELRAHYNPEGSDLRNLQKNLLDILVEFDAFARQNNLTYSISYGTLIGAIRHHGFVPWDDDADIMLTRQEWNELKMHIRPDGYITDSISIEGIVRPELHVRNKGIIDIFIMDYAPSNKVLDQLKGRICFLILLILKCKNRIRFHNFGHFKPWLILVPLAYCLPTKMLVRWKDKVAQWFTPQKMHDEDNVRLYNGDPKALRTIHSYGLVSGEKINVDFEGHQLMSIPNYDAFLRVWYGDYMQLPKRPTNLGRVTGADLCDIR